ncbi:MAG: PRD domain-containing protein [Lachnospiraceae bacterium]|nr:PRD domain-containing protein [Lachnospiraceae bacterium]
MKIIKILNNNIVISTDDQNHEIILMGRGIGFGKKPGMEADPARIERRFFGFSDRRYEEQLVELLERIPMEHISIGMQIVEHVRKHIQKPLNENLVLMLSDHISFAIERQKKGLALANSLLWEIRKFYPDEFQLGMDAVDIIEKETDVRLADDEAGFMALHILNAQYGTTSAVSQQMIMMIQDIINIVRYTYSIELDDSSLDYIRFVTHLKFFLKRIFTNSCYEKETGLYRMVSIMYPKAAACSRKIQEYIEKKINYTLVEEELGYLTIHIEKLTRN